jgi:hypothetical protein
MVGLWFFGLLRSAPIAPKQKRGRQRWAQKYPEKGWNGPIFPLKQVSQISPVMSQNKPSHESDRPSFLGLSEIFCTYLRIVPMHGWCCVDEIELNSLHLSMPIRVEFACFEAMAGAVPSVMTMARVAGRYRWCRCCCCGSRGVVEGDRHGCFVLCGVEEVENAQRLPLNKNVSKASFM